MNKLFFRQGPVKGITSFVRRRLVCLATWLSFYKRKKNIDTLKLRFLVFVEKSKNLHNKEGLEQCFDTN